MTGRDTAAEFSRALAGRAKQHYVLRLYVAGATAGSQRAIANLKAICETELRGRYTLEVVDVSHDAALAASEQVVAAPTMIKELPPPIRRLVGDMSDRDRVLLGLDLRPAAG